MTPEQQAALERVKDRLERLAQTGSLHPNRPQEKALRADHRAARAMFFRSVKGGIDAAPWLRSQLETDCAELLREAQQDRVSFDAARIVATVLRRESIVAADCIKDFEAGLISGDISPPNKNGNYTADQFQIDGQINQCVIELHQAGFKKTIGNTGNIYEIIAENLQSLDVKMGEQAIKKATKRYRDARAKSESQWQAHVEEFAAEQGKS